MRRRKSCVICDKPSNHFLFKDEFLNIPLCSDICETEYLKRLSPGTAAQMDVIRFIDARIDESKKRNRIMWGIAGIGVVIYIVAFVLPDVLTFLVGNVVAVTGAMLTRHYEDRINKLVLQRRRISIA